MLAPGTILDNRYSIVAEIGGGGFGSVFRAVQIGFDREVAIKILNTTLLQEYEGPARFEREARAMSAVQHKNIVSCYGYGAHNGAPYMVLELLEGTSLDKVLAKDVQIHPERALHIMRQVFEALQAAHAAGVVHRDLKPSNIMLVKEPERPDREFVKIIDFGLARLMPGYGVPGQKLTDTGYTLGTCHYMPPEQALGAPVDQRADIYSAGCILYQMLAGRLPFDAEDSVQVMHMHINEDAPPIEKFLAPNSAPYAVALGNFLQNCMAKSPEDRYLSAKEALDELNKFESGKDTKVIPRAVSSTRRRVTNKSSRKHLLASVSGALVLGIVLLGGGALILQRQHDQNVLESYRAQVAGFDVNPGLINASTIDKFSELARHDQQHPLLRYEERVLLNGYLCRAWHEVAEKTNDARAKKHAEQNCIEFGRNVIPLAKQLTEHTSEKGNVRCGLMVACGDYLRGLNAIDDTIAIWTNLSNTPSCYFQSRLHLVDLYMNLHRFDDAIAAVKPILEDSEYPGGRYLANLNMGNVLCMSGRLNEALHYYLDALDYPIAGGQQGAIAGQARVALMQGQNQKCIELADFSQEEFIRARGTLMKRVGSELLQGKKIPSNWGEHYPAGLMLKAAALARLGQVDKAEQMMSDFKPEDDLIKYDNGTMKEFDRHLVALVINDVKAQKTKARPQASHE